MDKFMIKVKKHFANKKNIVLWVLGTLVVTSIGLLASIYMYDKPEFIDPEIRGKIQEGIVDSVAEPLKDVNLTLGEKIESYSYQNRYVNRENVQDENQYREQNREEETKDWPTYTDEEAGFSIKYPEGWEVVESSASTKIYEAEYIEYEAEHPLIFIRTFALSPSADLEEWKVNNRSEYIGDLLPEEVEGFSNQEKGKINGHDSLSFTYQSMGENKVTLLLIDDYVVSIEGVSMSTVETAFGDNYEEIINSFR